MGTPIHLNWLFHFKPNQTNHFLQGCPFELQTIQLLGYHHLKKPPWSNHENIAKARDEAEKDWTTGRCRAVGHSSVRRQKNHQFPVTDWSLTPNCNIYIFIYLTIYMYIYNYIYIYITIYIITYIHTYIYIYIITYMHTYKHTYLHACMHIYIYIYI